MSALTGLRVLDLTRLLPGPVATLVLADLGATVDKVEDVGAGDYYRMTPPSAGSMGVGFHAINRGKRSLAVDLKRPEGVAMLRRLAGSYDVLFEQFRPGVMARLGLPHELLLEENPRLVVCALTGYGQTGPLRDRAGHDLNYLARSGLLGLSGPRKGPPQIPPFQLADVSGGLWSVIAILSALMERERTGRGQFLDISMTDSVIPFATIPLSRLLGGEVPERGNEMLTGGSALYRTYETKDGRAVALGALEPKFFGALFAALGEPSDFSAVMPGPHQEALQARLEQLFRERTRDEWEAFGQQHDCCLEPVLEPSELLDDPQHQARGVFFRAETADGPITEYRTPVTPRDLPARPAPRQGEHGVAILQDAGFSEAEIATLRKAGTIRTEP